MYILQVKADTIPEVKETFALQLVSIANEGTIKTVDKEASGDLRVHRARLCGVWVK